MAELFAFDKPICSDQTTQPNVTTAELKNAMALVYNHMHCHSDDALHCHRRAEPLELSAALDVMAEAANNENWVIYVP